MRLCRNTLTKAGIIEYYFRMMNLDGIGSFAYHEGTIQKKRYGSLALFLSAILTQTSFPRFNPASRQPLFLQHWNIQGSPSPGWINHCRERSYLGARLDAIAFIPNFSRPSRQQFDDTFLIVQAQESGIFVITHCKAGSFFGSPLVSCKASFSFFPFKYRSPLLSAIFFPTGISILFNNYRISQKIIYLNRIGRKRQEKMYSDLQNNAQIDQIVRIPSQMFSTIVNIIYDNDGLKVRLNLIILNLIRIKQKVSQSF